MFITADPDGASESCETVKSPDWSDPSATKCSRCADNGTVTVALAW